MTLEQLTALGVSEDVAKKVIEAHNKAIKDGYVTLDKFNQANGAKEQLEKDLKARDKQLKELGGKAKGNEELEKQIKELQETNKKASADYETKIKDMKLDNAIKLKLKEGNAKYEDLLVSKFDKSKLTIKEDGTVQGLDEQYKVVNESYGDLFGKGVTGTSPNNKGDADKGVDTSKMTYSEMVAYQEANPDKNIFN